MPTKVIRDPGVGAKYLKKLGVIGEDDELVEASIDFGNNALALTLLGTFIVNSRDGDISKRDTLPPLFANPEDGGHARRVCREYEELFKGKPELHVLRMLSLFDRRADAGAIRVVRSLSEYEWSESLNNLKSARLIEYTDVHGSIDCHALVREHFSKEYSDSEPEGFRKAHLGLYEYYAAQAPWQPETLHEMTPLFYAVYHGCKAGKCAEACTKIYTERILRDDAYYLWKHLGAFGIDLSLLANFFLSRWDKPQPDLLPAEQALVRSQAALALLAAGRLSEAITLRRESAEFYRHEKQWRSAAVSFRNLSQLYLALGEIRNAIEAAKQGIDAADISEDTNERIIERTALADALHQWDDVEQSIRWFEEAEQILSGEGDQFILNSLQGYQYCDLLLARGGSKEVIRRASLALSQKPVNLLSVGLDNLSMGRALPAQSQNCGEYLNKAVTGLREAGVLTHLPLGLLARARYFLSLKNFESAKKDLDAVRIVAGRCGMKLHLADYHLIQARCDLAQNKRDGAQIHYRRAGVLIDQTEYHRRERELENLARQLGRHL